MRDERRIDSFCKELAKIWRNKCPDWRFGQLISNVFGSSDPFYLEEDKAMDVLKKYFNIEAPEDMLVILIGKSGSGKSSVQKELVERGYKKVITSTTRPPRENEKNASDYTFLSDEDFEKYKSEGRFAETREYETVEGTWKYGSAVKSFENVTGKEVIVLTPSALDSVKKILADSKKSCIVCYLSVEENVLRRRLYERGDDSDEIERRLKADNIDFKDAGEKADYELVVGEVSVKKIADYICDLVANRMNPVLAEEDKHLHRKEWEEFHDSKLLWFCNTFLHLFGWSLVFDDGIVYPARTDYRGFPEKVNTEGYKGLTKYMNDNVIQLMKDVE